MEALTRHAPARVDFVAPVFAHLARRLALAVLVLVVLVGLLVCWRRVSGALVEPLGGGMLAALGAALAVWALLFRQSFTLELKSAPAYALWAAPSVALLLWVAGVSLRGSDALGLVALVGVLLLEEGWSWGRVAARRELATTPRIAPPVEVIRQEVPRVRELLVEEAPDEAVTQQLVRRREAAGEVLAGFVRVDFAPSQRHATAHVAICPPLARVPVCFAEVADGPAAQIKIAQVLPYGVRFELKLDEAANEPASVTVEFSIQEHGDAAGEDSSCEALG